MNPEDQNTSNLDANSTNNDPVKIGITQAPSGDSGVPAQPDTTTDSPSDSTPVAEQPAPPAETSFSPATPTDSQTDVSTPPTVETPLAEPTVSEVSPSTPDVTSDVSAQPDQSVADPVAQQTQSPPSEPLQPAPTSGGAEQQGDQPVPTGTAPKKTLGVMSIIFAILLPPIGFILSIVSIIKGFKKDRTSNTLGTLGIIGLICSIFVAPIIWAITITAVVGVQEKSKWMNYSTKTGEISATKYKIDVPKAYTSEFKQDSESNGYGIKADEDTYLSQTVVSISAYPEAKQIQGAFTAYESANPTDKANFEKSFGEGFKPSFESEIGCKNTTFNNFSTTKLSGTTNAMQFNFNCTSKKYDKYQVQGQLIIGVDDSKLIGLFLASESDVYKKHSDAWPKIINSFQVTQ